MEYALVSDDCDNCRYVVNAFALLKLTLKVVPIGNLSEKHTRPTTTLICQHIESKHKNQVEKLMLAEPVSVIFLREPTETKQISHKPIYYLKIPFTQYELSSALIQCTHHQFTTFDINHCVFQKLVGQSPQILQIKTMIKQVASSNITVLILGQSGTGKDVIASCIHSFSERAKHPFVPINCGAIPSELMESELFGHEKGAFTGALARRAGRFEMAHTGTLFLDEIGDMPLPMQVKLLRVIQERKIERVGGNNSIDVDVRLIAATNKNLDELIQSQKFREDLYYRINVFPIHVPSLSERPEDIPLLIDYHVDKISERLKHHIFFTDRAKEILCEYTWPGNIRELQNFLERMVILFPDGVIDEEQIDAAFKKKKPYIQALPKTLGIEPFNLKQYIATLEQQIIETALKQTNGVISHTAKYLSLNISTLNEKIKKYKLLESTKG